MTSRVFIGGLPFEFRDEDSVKLLRGLNYEKIKVIYTKEGDCRGFMYVDMDVNDVGKCRNRLNRTKYKGGTLRVEDAEPDYIEKKRIEELRELEKLNQAKEEEHVVDYNDKEKWQKVNGIHFPVLRIKDYSAATFQILEVIPSHNRYKHTDLDDGKELSGKAFRNYEWLVPDEVSSEDSEVQSTPTRKYNAYEEAQIYFQKQREKRLLYPREDSFEVVADKIESDPFATIQYFDSSDDSISTLRNLSLANQSVTPNTNIQVNPNADSDDSFEVVQENPVPLKGSKEKPAYGMPVPSGSDKMDEDSFEVVSEPVAKIESDKMEDEDSFEVVSEPTTKMADDKDDSFEVVAAHTPAVQMNVDDSFEVVPASKQETVSMDVDSFEVMPAESSIPTFEREISSDSFEVVKTSDILKTEVEETEDPIEKARKEMELAKQLYEEKMRLFMKEQILLETERKKTPSKKVKVSKSPEKVAKEQEIEQQKVPVKQPETKKMEESSSDSSSESVEIKKATTLPQVETPKKMQESSDSSSDSSESEQQKVPIKQPEKKKMEESSSDSSSESVEIKKMKESSGSSSDSSESEKHNAPAKQPEKTMKTEGSSDSSSSDKAVIPKKSEKMKKDSSDSDSSDSSESVKAENTSPLKDAGNFQVDRSESELIAADPDTLTEEELKIRSNLIRTQAIKRMEEEKKRVEEASKISFSDPLQNKRMVFSSSSDDEMSVEEDSDSSDDSSARSKKKARYADWTEVLEGKFDSDEDAPSLFTFTDDNNDVFNDRSGVFRFLGEEDPVQNEGFMDVSSDSSDSEDLPTSILEMLTNVKEVDKIAQNDRKIFPFLVDDAWKEKANKDQFMRSTSLDNVNENWEKERTGLTSFFHHRHKTAKKRKRYN